jgi:hypothetical protein
MLLHVLLDNMERYIQLFGEIIHCGSPIKDCGFDLSPLRMSADRAFPVALIMIPARMVPHVPMSGPIRPCLSLIQCFWFQCTNSNFLFQHLPFKMLA